MKAVLASIKPEHCEHIVSGIKTMEIRKTRPKIDTPFKCYIYCTNDNVAHNTEKQFWKKDSTGFEWLLNGKVIGEFICNYIEDFKEFEYGIDSLYRHIKLNACIDYDKIYKYLGYEKCGYGWHISDLKIYDKPKALSCFEKPCPYDDCFRCEYYDDWSMEEPPCCNYEVEEIKRPPQSWCYVEGV